MVKRVKKGPFLVNRQPKSRLLPVIKLFKAFQTTFVSITFSIRATVNVFLRNACVYARKVVIDLSLSFSRVYLHFTFYKIFSTVHG